MIDLCEQDFDTFITNSQGKAFVEFWSKGCVPCAMMAGILEKAEVELPSVAFARVDVGECPSLAREFKVISVPTMLLFDNGVARERIVGTVSLAQLANMSGEGMSGVSGNMSGVG